VDERWRRELPGTDRMAYPFLTRADRTAYRGTDKDKGKETRDGQRK
jgi:hypothetical protein